MNQDGRFPEGEESVQRFTGMKNIACRETANKLVSQFIRLVVHKCRSGRMNLDCKYAPDLEGLCITN